MSHKIISAAADRAEKHAARALAAVDTLRRTRAHAGQSYAPAHVCAVLDRALDDARRRATGACLRARTLRALLAEGRGL